MRIVLALLIAVTQTAGPWLCCCGPARLARVFDVSKPAELLPAPASCQTACPHCAKSHDEPPAPPAEPGRKPTPPEQCPCGCVELVAVPATKSDGDDATADGGLVQIAAEVPHPVTIVSCSPNEVVGLRELPHLTTAERLYVHHALRC